MAHPLVGGEHVRRDELHPPDRHHAPQVELQPLRQAEDVPPLLGAAHRIRRVPTAAGERDGERIGAGRARGGRRARGVRLHDAGRRERDLDRRPLGGGDGAEAAASTGAGAGTGGR